MSLGNIFRKKSFTTLKSEANSKIFLRDLDLTQLVILGLGAVIGGGVFVFTGKAAFLHAGPAVVISFALAGFICVCAGLCYAELASLFPVAGSSYTYIYATFGEFPAWLMGCSTILAYFLASASVGSGWSSYFSSILNDFHIHISDQYLYRPGFIIESASGVQQNSILDLPAFVISFCSMVFLSISTSSSALLNTCVVMIKIIVLILFICFGITKIDIHNWQPFIPESIKFGQYGVSGIVAGISIVFLGFIGFESVCTAAQETKNPQKSIPTAIIGSIIISTTIYILVALVLTGMINYKLLNTTKPISLAVELLNMPILSLLIKWGAVAAMTSVILVHQYTITRLLYSISKDGLLPKIFHKMHKKYRTPYLNTIIVGIAMGIVSATMQIEKILRLSSFFGLLGIITVCTSTIYLRLAQPDKERCFQCPFVPITPLIAIVSSFSILCNYPTDIIFYAICCLIFITIIYFFYGRKKSKLA